MTASQWPVRMKRLTLDLPEPLHRAIKKSAAGEGVTMAQKLRTLLSKHYRTAEETS
jgi:predicted DNA binding CopG/RHH family protein